jgi:hypothetical protein
MSMMTVNDIPINRRSNPHKFLLRLMVVWHLSEVSGETDRLRSPGSLSAFSGVERCFFNLLPLNVRLNKDHMFFILDYVYQYNDNNAYR